jgi:hypothetical protein
MIFFPFGCGWFSCVFYLVVAYLVVFCVKFWVIGNCRTSWRPLGLLGLRIRRLFLCFVPFLVISSCFWVKKMQNFRTASSAEFLVESFVVVENNYRQYFQNWTLFPVVLVGLIFGGFGGFSRFCSNFLRVLIILRSFIAFLVCFVAVVLSLLSDLLGNLFISFKSPWIVSFCRRLINFSLFHYPFLAFSCDV